MGESAVVTFHFTYPKLREKHFSIDSS